MSGTSATDGESAAPPGAPTESTTVASDVLVQFTRQGGILGLSDQLTVLDTGAVTVVRSKPAVNHTGQLTAAELANLRQLLAAPGLTTLAKPKPVTGNDLYAYRVNFGDIRLAAEQSAVDPALEPLISALTEIVEKYDS